MKRTRQINKKFIKQHLYGFEVRVAAIISNGLVHRTPKQVTLKLVKREIQQITGRLNLPPTVQTQLWQDSYARYVKVSRATFASLRKENKFKGEENRSKKTPDYEQELAVRQNIVYQQMRKELKMLEKQKNEAANDVEFRAKHDEIQGLLDGNGIFFLCSTHKNPAKDHADWEGKMYYAADWEDKIPDGDNVTRAKIEAYIRNHRLRTVEWVVGEPVWLITRPNCKHFFIEMDTDEVLHSSVKSLIKRYKAIMPDDIPMSYEYEQYRDYYERLKVLLYLRKMCPSEKLDADIKDTRRLVLKWKNRAMKEAK